MTERVEQYMDYLREREEELGRVLLGMEQESLDEEADSLWRTLVIQQNLYIVIENEGMSFSSEEGKGCLIDTLDKFVQYFGHSRRISELIYNSINLKALNQIYC